MFYIYLYSNSISVLYFTLIQEYKLQIVLRGRNFLSNYTKKRSRRTTMPTFVYSLFHSSLSMGRPDIYRCVFTHLRKREKKRKNQCRKNLQRSLEFLFRWKCNIFLSKVKVISCRMIKGCRKRSFEGPTLAFGPFMVLLHLWGFRSLQKSRQIRFLSLILPPLLKNVANCLQKKETISLNLHS